MCIRNLSLFCAICPPTNIQRHWKFPRMKICHWNALFIWLNFIMPNGENIFCAKFLWIFEILFIVFPNISIWIRVHLSWTDWIIKFIDFSCRFVSVLRRTRDLKISTLHLIIQLRWIHRFGSPIKRWTRPSWSGCWVESVWWRRSKKLTALWLLKAVDSSNLMHKLCRFLCDSRPGHVRPDSDR